MMPRLMIRAVLATILLSPAASSQNAATVTWPLTDPSNGGTGLTSSSTGQFVGSDLRLNNMDINRYTGPDSSIRIRMAGTGNTWPANQVTQIDTVYMQFKASAKAGVTALIDSVILRLGANSTNSMKANIYYSKDSTFAAKTQVAFTTSSTTSPAGTYLVSGALDVIIATPNLALNAEESFYFRIYPWVDNLAPTITGKYICPQNVVIKGTTSGSAPVFIPTLTTTLITSISTTTASSGGHISSDGGAEVTAKGVCWNTTGSPSTADNHTSDGLGGGPFSSLLTGLTPGTTYQVRAYATNPAGTSYGNEVSFITLTSIVVPTVTTSSVSGILVKTAACGGNVTAWGGASIIARGVCWNSKGAPTITDSKTVDGNGLGSFTSGLTGLSANTTYFVRAYATNSVGTGYGAEVSFTTQMPQRDTTVVVAKDGSGNYTTVQAAFRAVPANYTGVWTIFVKKGSYYEKDTLAVGKVNVVLAGEDRDSTVITYDDYGDRYGSGNPGTNGSFTISIDANDFIAKNITFQNTFSPRPGVSGAQAVALRGNGDRQEFINCRILGYQDTYYTWGGSGAGRVYHKRCFIEGTVDFIFGRNVVVFDSCTIHVIRDGGTITAASTDGTSQFGYVFRNCTIFTDSIGFDGAAISSFYLGRPWQSSPRTVFLNCNEPATLHTAGWLAWNVVPALYAEYKCFGSGAATNGRISWSTQLSAAAAAQYSLTNIFAKSATASNLVLYDWMPSQSGPGDDLPLITAVQTNTPHVLPGETLLNQNYPNPLNGNTTITFQLSAFGHVVLKLYDLRGREVQELVRGEFPAGTHSILLKTSELSSGVYLYRLVAGTEVRARKMLLLK